MYVCIYIYIYIYIYTYIYDYHYDISRQQATTTKGVPILFRYLARRSTS